MKSKIIPSLILGSAVMLAASAAHAWTVSTVPNVLKPEQGLIETLLGSNSGITVVPGSESYIGRYIYQAGISSNGEIVMTTGAFENHKPGYYSESRYGTHQSGWTSTGTGSNAELAALLGIPVKKTADQNVLTFSFTVDDPTMNTISTSFVFASDEYSRVVWGADPITERAYVMGDAFAFFVDGVNYAYLPDGSLVQANQIDFFQDGKDYGYAGRTDRIDIVASLDPNRTVHTISIVIADADTWLYNNFITIERYDSGVFIGPLSLSYTPAVPEPETWAMLLAGLGLVGVTAKRRSRQK